MAVISSGHGWFYYFRILGIRRGNIRYNIFGYNRDVVGGLLLLRGANPLLIWRSNLPGYLAYIIDISLGILSAMMIFIMYVLGDSILRRVVPFLRSHVDDRYVGRDVSDIYYLDFLIRAIFNKMALLSAL